VKKDFPDRYFAQVLYIIAENKHFDSFIMVCIILNSFALAMKWYGETEAQTISIDAINLLFTAIFTLEAAIKLIAFKREYFIDSWNRFDFFIVSVSIIELIVTQFVSFNLLVIITLFRIFRIGRVLRLIKTASALRVIFSTFVLTLP
jgi:voltage-dependent calcium channel L type alpha-1D